MPGTGDIGHARAVQLFATAPQTCAASAATLSFRPHCTWYYIGRDSNTRRCKDTVGSNEASDCGGELLTIQAGRQRPEHFLPWQRGPKRNASGLVLSLQCL